MAALTASTDNIVTTNGAAIAGFSFGEVGFADGYSTLVYSNTQALSNTQSALGVLVASLPESTTITEAESALGTFFGVRVESSTITEAESVLRSIFASLPESITITEAESALGVLVASLPESSTITEAESVSQNFPVSETGSTQTITEAMSVLRSIFASLPESITITEAESAIGLFYGLLAESSTIIDYQFGRGWIKVNDDQNPNWVQIDDNQ